MLLLFLEIAKREILEREEEQKYKRLFSLQENLYEEYRQYYYKYFALKTFNKLTISKIRRKVIKNSLKDIVSDTEALRLILEKELDKFKKKKLHYKTDFKSANALFFPYLFKQGKEKGKFMKVDIRSCFYEIYSRIGIDASTKAQIDHNKKVISLLTVGKGVITREESEIIKMLQNEKILRNTVYGLTRCAFITVLNNSEIKRQYIRPRLQNLDLTVLIASFLHHFVSMFKNFIIYWNIDGGIIKAEGYEKMKEFLLDHGFALKKEYEGSELEVLGLGSYRLDDFYTLHYANKLKSHIPEKTYIYEVRNIEKILKWFKR